MVWANGSDCDASGLRIGDHVGMSQPPAVKSDFINLITGSTAVLRLSLGCCHATPGTRRPDFQVRHGTAMSPVVRSVLPFLAYMRATRLACTINDLSLCPSYELPGSDFARIFDVANIWQAVDFTYKLSLWGQHRKSTASISR